jgi:hypothetical protein
MYKRILILLLSLAATAGRSIGSDPFGTLPVVQPVATLPGLEGLPTLPGVSATPDTQVSSPFGLDYSKLNSTQSPGVTHTGQACTNLGLGLATGGFCAGGSKATGQPLIGCLSFELGVNAGPVVSFTGSYTYCPGAENPHSFCGSGNASNGAGVVGVFKKGVCVNPKDWSGSEFTTIGVGYGIDEPGLRLSKTAEYNSSSSWPAAEPSSTVWDRATLFTKPASVPKYNLGMDYSMLSVKPLVYGPPAPPRGKQVYPKPIGPVPATTPKPAPKVVPLT